MVLAAVLAVPGAAAAADFPTMLETPPVGVVTSWTGFYAGVQAGTGMVVSEQDYPSGYAPPELPYNDYGGEGLSGGVFAGYERQFGRRFVAGIEAAGNLREIVSYNDTAHYDSFYRSNWSASVRGRAGLLRFPLDPAQPARADREVGLVWHP
jgi:outer membrane immunogenic protein